MNLMHLKKRRRHGGGDAGYWPGYVGALINVVLSLMFLAAMLAVGSFIVGLDFSRKTLLSAMKASVEQAARISKERLEKSSSAPFVFFDVEGTEAPASSNEVGIEPPGGRENQGLLQVKFTGDALALNDTVRNELGNGLRDLLRTHPDATLVVWAVSDTDPRYQRASFLRVMALREALIGAGAESRRIVTRIVTGKNTTADGQIVYVLVRSTNQNEHHEQ
jgi:hypothetical protein